MGVERSVTRWYLQRQMILNEIGSLEERLRRTTRGGQASAQGPGLAGQAEQETLQQQLFAAREKLRRIGPCPKPMMG
jgi:hypothetical protein